MNKELKKVSGILLGYKYRSPYVRGWYQPVYVDENNDFVVFYHNPGWIGSWYWMTSISNFKKNFLEGNPDPKKGTVSNIKYVSITNGFNKPEVSTKKTFNEKSRLS